MTEQMLQNLLMQVDTEISTLINSASVAYTLRDMKRKQTDLEELVLTRSNIFAMVSDEPVVQQVKITPSGPAAVEQPSPLTVYDEPVEVCEEKKVRKTYSKS